MTDFLITIKRHHIDWCHNEIGRLYELIMANPNDKDTEKWFARLDNVSRSADRARRELDKAGVSHN